MPRGNGTGPMGMGPMTGRKAGFCAGYSMPGYQNAAGFGGGWAAAWARARDVPQLRGGAFRRLPRLGSRVQRG
jgi:hypothetical protein